MKKKLTKGIQKELSPHGQGSLHESFSNKIVQKGTIKRGRNKRSLFV